MSTHTTVAARLALEDGTVFHGTAFGATAAEATGEVVFNTAMCGYQEALSDPSYTGQILTMTATQMGNYGIAAEDIESGKPQVRAFIVRELARLHTAPRSVSPSGSPSTAFRASRASTRARWCASFERRVRCAAW